MAPKTPDVPPARVGPSTPTTAAANPTASRFNSLRSFGLRNTNTGASGLPFNPNLARRNTGNRQQTGGSS